jgi:flagellar hook-length control protein FliK
MPAKSKDCKPAEPHDDAKPAITDDTAADETLVDGNNTKIDGKKSAKPEAAAEVGDSIQPDADGVPPAKQHEGDTKATPPADGIVTVASSDAISIVPAPAQTPDVTPGDGTQVEQPLQQVAVAADAILNKMKLPGDDPPKTVAGKKTDDGKGKQVDGAVEVKVDQPITETDNAFETLTTDAAPQRAEGKPQTEAGDDDKQHALQSRSDVVTSNHRPDASGPTLGGSTDLAGTAKVSADTTTQLPMPSAAAHSTASSAAPNAPTLPPTPQPVAVPLSGVAIEIAGKALAGKNRFEIRLDPPELGRIEVRLDVDRDGNVTSRLTVDRQDTLDLLRRDAAGLERALQDAGLKTANNGLQFSLRDQSMNEQQADTSPGSAVLVANDESISSIDVIPQRYRLAGQGGGLDIRV